MLRLLPLTILSASLLTGSVQAIGPLRIKPPSRPPSVTVFGSSGGVGQLLCQRLARNNAVKAVSRSASTASLLPPSCELIQADARIPSTLPAAVKGADVIVIAVGTTAFPSSKWAGGNDPQEACATTVRNILAAAAATRGRPTIVLLSSIGVDRKNQFPFKILNAYGVLDAKKQAEESVLEYARKTGASVFVVRPGRLVGAPYSNLDLAKLLRLDSGNKRSVLLSAEDDIAGDTDRADVAELVARLVALRGGRPTVLSVVNTAGGPPSDQEWGELISSVTM